MHSSSDTTTPLARAALALETQAAFRDWPEWLPVRVSGEDRVAWLNGQITNDVRELAPGASVHALAVNVRGKILAEVWATDLGEALLLLVPRNAADALLENLERYIIMEDVVLERVPDWRVLSVEGPGAEAAAAGLGNEVADVVRMQWSPLGIGGYAFIGPEAALAQVAAQLESRAARIEPAAYDLVRLRHAAPRFGVDYDEHHYPQEAGLKALVSFQKGCYIGQEVVCTLENRGKLSKQLWVMESASEHTPAPGTNLQLGEAAGSESVGSTTSAVWDPEQKRSRVLGYVRRVHAKPGSEVLAGAQPLTLVHAVGEEEAAR